MQDAEEHNEDYNADRRLVREETNQRSRMILLGYVQGELTSIAKFNR